MKVLVVSPRPQLAGIVRKSLGLAEGDVLHAGTSATACAALAPVLPDVAVVVSTPPDAPGAEIVRAIRDAPGGRCVRLVLIDDEKRLVDGVTVLPKPVDLNALLAVLRGFGEDIAGSDLPSAGLDPFGDGA